MKTIVLIFSFLLIAGFTFFGRPQPYQFPDAVFFPEIIQPSDNIATIEGVELGRYLFYDSLLSSDYSLTCAGCHQQQYAFSEQGVRFSMGITATPMRRNTPPLFNLAWQPYFFWDGRSPSLEDQVSQPIHALDEFSMSWETLISRLQKSDFYRQKFKAAFGSDKIDSTMVKKAIAQFERTLISHQSKYDMVLEGKARFTEDERKGYILMNEVNQAGCMHCHITDGSPLGTNFRMSNNGIDSFMNAGDFPDQGFGMISGRMKDIGKFKTPSLRNIALTAPYMHDGRFQTLEEVLKFYSEGVRHGLNLDAKMTFAYQGGAQLTCEEQEQIIAFLHTLTDSIFIANPDFSNPF